MGRVSAVVDKEKEGKSAGEPSRGGDAGGAPRPSSCWPCWPCSRPRAGREGGCVAAFAAFPHSSASVPSPWGTLSGCGPGGREHSEFCLSRGLCCAYRGHSPSSSVSHSGALWLILLLCPRFWGRHGVVLIFLRVRAASFALSCNNRAIEDF